MLRNLGAHATNEKITNQDASEAGDSRNRISLKTKIQKNEGTKIKRRAGELKFHLG